MAENKGKIDVELGKQFESDTYDIIESANPAQVNKLMQLDANAVDDQSFCPPRSGELLWKPQCAGG